MNNDTVGPKSDDDSGAEPSGSNTIPPRGPERETEEDGHPAGRPSNCTRNHGNGTGRGRFRGLARVHGIRGERQP